MIKRYAEINKGKCREIVENRYFKVNMKYICFEFVDRESFWLNINNIKSLNPDLKFNISWDLLNRFDTTIDMKVSGAKIIVKELDRDTIEDTKEFEKYTLGKC